MIIENNTAPEKDELPKYPYFIVTTQRRFITTKMHIVHSIDS